MDDVSSGVLGAPPSRNTTKKCAIRVKSENLVRVPDTLNQFLPQDLCDIFISILNYHRL